MNLVWDFIEQVKRNIFRLNEQEKNVILYALVKGFVDSGSKIICALPVKDIFYFWNIKDGDETVFKNKSTELIQKFSVKIEDKKSTTCFGLIERFLYDGEGVVITFDLNRVEQWLQYISNKE